jgi:ferredoxin-NADP reductase
MPDRASFVHVHFEKNRPKNFMEEEKEHMTTVATPPITAAKLLSRHEVAEGTMAFRFERPAKWAFKAGQYLDMTLLDPPETDSEGNVRSFSIASGPHEETLMVATRMRDTAFKRVLRTMPLGTAVKIEGPSGEVTLPDSLKRTSVFLAGGIGITPFRSMICLAAAERLQHQMFLFYFQSATGGRAFPRRASAPGKRQSEVQIDRHYDRHG